jgi:hypothetical protein
METVTTLFNFWKLKVTKGSRQETYGSLGMANHSIQGGVNN